MKKRKSPEYKLYVAKLVVEDGRKATDVAYELELPVSTVHRWVMAYREERERLENPNHEHLMSASEMKKQLADAERRLQEQEEEIEILKKAMHVFMKNRP